MGRAADIERLRGAVCALQPRGRREESLQAAQVEELLSDAAGNARVARGGEAGCVQDRLLRLISAHLV